MFRFPSSALPRTSLMLALLLPAVAGAQAPPVPAAAEAGYRPATGDAWIDRQLADLEAYAQRYPDSFVDEVARYAGVRRGYLQALLQQHHWHAGDIYFACFWARATHLSCRQLVQARSRERDASWQALVGQLPVPPDNLHYRALRHALVASYDRWDRPIVLDATLQRQLGDPAQRQRRAAEAADAADAADRARL